MAIDLLADAPSKGVDLLADQPQAAAPVANQPSFSDLSKADQAKAMDLVRQQAAAQYPNVPNWVRNMMIAITPKDASPNLQKAADIAQANTNFIPVTAGGLIQGFSLPFRGAASFLPGKAAQAFANAPDYTSYFPAPQDTSEQLIQGGAELVGSLGPIGKLFGALKGASAAARVPQALQNTAALTGTGAIATPGDVTDKTMGTIGALAAGGAGKIAATAAGKIPTFLRSLMNPTTPQDIVDTVQNAHDTLSNTANELYGYVKNEINNRGISIPVKPEYIQEATDVLPKTRASQKLIQAATTGDYNAVHDLQSQLYKKGTSGLASDDIAIQNQGDEILDLRNKINDDLNSHLMQTGNSDIAHVLDQGKDIYKQLMDTYFNKNLPSSVSKLVHPDIRLVPDNPEDLMSQNSKPMSEFLAAHPGLSKQVQDVQDKKAAMKALSKVVTTGAKVGGVSYLGKSLFDFLK